MPRQLAVIGAGGFAREVAWLVRDLEREGQPWRVRGFLLSDLRYAGPRDDPRLLVGDFDWLEAHRGEVDGLVFGIGSPGAKARILRELASRGLAFEWPTLVHPSVRFDAASCTLGAGVVLCAGVIGTVDLRLEDHAMVNLACTLGHGARIGRFAVLNPGVNVSGGVVLEDEVMVGTGAQLLECVTLGAGCTVGAGAVVTKDVPQGVTVVGVPARPLARG